MRRKSVDTTAAPPAKPPRTSATRSILRSLWLIPLVLVPCALSLFFVLLPFEHFAFKQPGVLVACLLALALSYYVLFVRGRQRKGALTHSGATLASRFRPRFFGVLSDLPAALRLVALLLFVLALAHPQTRDRGGQIEVEGIDIMVALDMSRSMEAPDLAPNRLEAAKRVLDAFISRRRSDRIGLVVFGQDAFTLCPLTLDYSALRTMLGDLELGAIDGTRTAIGNALGLSLSRLRRSDAKSRVVILLTDGENNSGNVTPEQATKYAEAMGVQVFTILMGPSGDRPQMARDIWGRMVPVEQHPVNPKLLQTIAERTKGRFYLATDRAALEQNFERILAALDKSVRRDVAAVYEDAFRPFLVLGLLLLGCELLLRLTRMREFP